MGRHPARDPGAPAASLLVGRPTVSTLDEPGSVQTLSSAETNPDCLHKGDFTILRCSTPPHQSNKPRSLPGLRTAFFSQQVL